MSSPFLKKVVMINPPLTTCHSRKAILKDQGVAPFIDNKVEIQSVTHVLVLVVILGSLFVEDEIEHDDEDDFQENRSCRQAVPSRKTILRIYRSGRFYSFRLSLFSKMIFSALILR